MSANLVNELVSEEDSGENVIQRERTQKHESEMAAKKKEEESRLEKARVQAEAALKKLYADRVLKIEQRQEQNKRAEDIFKQQRDATLTKGQDWERVVSLIDTTGPYSTGEKDRTRFRELLIKLKH